LQIIGYAKARLTNKAVGFTESDETQKKNDLLCAVLKVMSWYTFSLLIEFCRHIMFLKLRYCNRSGDGGSHVGQPCPELTCWAYIPSGILFGGGVQQIHLRTKDRERGSGGRQPPIIRGSGSSCNLVQEISFHIVKFS